MKYECLVHHTIVITQNVVVDGVDREHALRKIDDIMDDLDIDDLLTDGGKADYQGYDIDECHEGGQ